MPATFETSPKRAVRADEERTRREEEQRKEKYEAHKKTQTDQYIAEHPQEFARLKDAFIKKSTERYGNDFPKNLIETIAQSEARLEIGKKAVVLSFEEFTRAEQTESAHVAQPDTGTPPRLQSTGDLVDENTKMSSAPADVVPDSWAESLKHEKAYEAYVQQRVDASKGNAELEALIAKHRAYVRREFPNMTP